MTPRDEILETRVIGENGALLLYRTVGLVAVTRNFPVPPGSTSWDESAIAEMAHDFLDGERGRKRLIELAIRSHDDNSFARLLEAGVVNFLRDKSRGTDMGKLITRVTKILVDEDEFVLLPGRPARWKLTDGPEETTLVPSSDLSRAISTVQVVVPKWLSAERDAPLADKDSYVRLLTTVLFAADGSMTAVDLAQILATRLEYRRSPLTTELDIMEGVGEPAAFGGDPAAESVGTIHAADIFNQLSDRERILISMRQLNVRDLGDVLDMGKSQAGLLRSRLRDALAERLVDDEHAETTLKSLCDLTDLWVRQRTSAGDATFHSNVTQCEKGDTK